MALLLAHESPRRAQIATHEGCVEHPMDYALGWTEQRVDFRYYRPRVSCVCDDAGVCAKHNVCVLGGGVAFVSV